MKYKIKMILFFFVCCAIMVHLLSTKNEMFQDHKRTHQRSYDTPQQAYDAASINVQWAIPSAS